MPVSTHRTPYRILIADSHQVFKLGLKNLLQSDPVFSILTDVYDGEEVLNTLKISSVDLLVLGVNSLGQTGSYNGTNISRIVKKRFPNVKVLLLPCYKKFNSNQEFINTGADGVISRSESKEDFLHAIRSLCSGEPYNRSKEMLENENPENESNKAPITKREMEILKLIFSSKTNPEIAEMLNISRRTVDTHRKNLLRKLVVRNTAGLIRYAIQHGLVQF